MSYLLLLSCLLISCTVAYDWTEAQKVLTDAIADGAFPGCSAMVVYKGQVLLKTAFGKFTYFPKGPPPPLDNNTNPSVTTSTIWDMASCSKVIGATSAAAILYQRGLLDISARVSSFLGEEYNSEGKADITVLNCLLHDAGYPGDPSPGYWEKATKCPNSDEYHPKEDFSCSAIIFDRLLKQKLENPVGKKYVYSDLSFITLAYVIGSVVHQKALVAPSQLRPVCAKDMHEQPNKGQLYLCYFEAYLRLHVFGVLGMKDTQYLPPASIHPNLPPTRDDTWYRHEVSQGVVDDENAYSMGGISGHAGIFSTLDDILSLMQVWLYGRRPDMLNATTVKLWITEYDHKISSRALGWNTNDLSVPDGGWNGTCGHLSSKTYLHVGYTGTQICADPVEEVLTVLLTNRVYPTGNNIKIREVRQAWNDAVAKQFKK